MKKSKLPNYPVKPNKQVDKMVIPEFDIEYKEFNCTFWLSFKNVPMSPKDVVIAFNLDSNGVAGAASRMIFPPTKQAVFPMMVQLEDVMGRAIFYYYSTKKNAIYVFDAIDCSSNGMYGTPDAPYKLSVDDAVKLEDKA
jgi:hypothetical protein